MSIIKRLLIIPLSIVLSVLACILLFIGKALSFLGDTISFYICMGMAKFFDYMKWHNAALTWLKCYGRIHL